MCKRACEELTLASEHQKVLYSDDDTYSLILQCARIVEEAVGKMQGISLKACIYGYVNYCTRSLFTAPISSTVDFIFMKLTRF